MNRLLKNSYFIPAHTKIFITVYRDSKRRHDVTAVLERVTNIEWIVTPEYIRYINDTKMRPELVFTLPNLPQIKQCWVYEYYII